jgi:putative toxin-antitoxin system antitoxin component (TIGR02293 family)
MRRSVNVIAAPEFERNRQTKGSADEAVVLDRAVEVIGDKNAALRWMGTPVQALDYSTPVSLLGTRKGREAVMVVLGRLEHGVL